MIYRRGTFVELFDILNHVSTGTRHTAELTDTDITGPHDPWHQHRTRGSHTVF